MIDCVRGVETRLDIWWYFLRERKRVAVVEDSKEKNMENVFFRTQKQVPKNHMTLFRLQR